MSGVESSLQSVRLEYVKESTEAEPPSDPSWSVLTDYLDEFTFSPGSDREAIEVVGSGDFRDMFRGAEESEVTTNYYKQQGFYDSGGSPQYPAGELFDYQDGCDLPSYTVVSRQEYDCDGNFTDSGYREYVVLFGAKPTEVVNPGDPSEASPIIEELSWQVRKGRTYVIHQPDSATTLEIDNAGSSSVDVTVENEDASTSETVTVSAGGTATTVDTYSNVDVIYAESDHDGDITVTDGSGTNVLDAATPLAGSDTDGVESDNGIPPLGSGSHGSALGTDPGDYRFQGITDGDGIDWQGTELSDRIHTLDLTVSIDTERDSIEGARGNTIDPGTRTVEVEADLAGPSESASRIAEHFHNESGNVVYPYPDNDVTVYNAQITDVPDYTRSAGDANYIPSTTWMGHGDASNDAVEVTYTG
jgi:hypothetical protein